jgi:glycyl-tRNA synthetase
VQHLKVGDAVRDGVINNETLGYFIARVASFLVAVGIHSTHIRFRQHLDTEMAHYASDCWDAEIYTSYGWVEMVGIADRACFDLEQHSKATNTLMTANETFKEPVKVIRRREVSRAVSQSDSPRLSVCGGGARWQAAASWQAGGWQCWL